MNTVTAILKQALAHEAKGTAIYEKAAEITTHDDSRMLFLELAQMEDGHATQLIEQAAKSFKDINAAELKKFVDEEEGKPAPEAIVAEMADGEMRDVLNAALRFEKEAIDHYNNLLGAVESDDLKRLCQTLLKEEQGHVKQIERTLMSLDMPDEERPDL
uniref:Rubrerythrin diiron-binding domain-containing protein n=1 Tax=Magnetococcus massalia (strain MO-1) TaxID=451514 RepID=A0A1S7LG09_MAGMO|nr:conserved protein of unknown function [include Rubrerythrin domain] [Candidatus Magnetococcus massalia]